MLQIKPNQNPGHRGEGIDTLYIYRVSMVRATICCHRYSKCKQKNLWIREDLRDCFPVKQDMKSSLK